MVTAALISFALLLVAWIAAPERRGEETTTASSAQPEPATAAA